MTLLAPLALLGLLGLALPLLAHLRGRSTPRVLPFAAVRFLPTEDPVDHPRRQPRDRALLAVRLLLLALAVVALARPASPSPVALAVVAEPHDAILLVDASASMGLVDGGETRLVAATRAADGLLAALPAGSRVGLVVSDPAGPRVDLSADPGRVASALAAFTAAPPRPGAWRLADTLPLAAALLGPDEGRPRVIYAIGDRTRGGLAGLPDVAPGDLPIVPVPPDGPADAAPTPVDHIGLDDATWEPAPDLDPRAVRIRATLRHHGAADPQRVRAVPVLLREGDAVVARAEAQVAAGATATVEFTHTPVGEGPSAATLELELEGDPLPVDDRRHLWLAADDDLEVAVVNGDPSEIRTRDEVFFLATALAAPATPDAGPRVRLRTLAPDQLDAAIRQDPARALAVDVLVLANVGAPAEDIAAAIARRVDAGMGLWITVGGRVDAAAYNRRFGDLLPLRLREAILAGTAPGRAEAVSEGIAPANLDHPALRRLGGDLGLLGARVRRLFLLDPDPARPADVALTYASGAPLLLSRPHGRGRVALLTTSLDRDWSDLPLRPGFVPLVLRTVAYLGDQARAAGPRTILAGEPWIAAAGPTAVVTPDGRQIPLAAGDDGRVRFADTLHLGHHQALRGEGEPPLLFTVDPDPRESDTAPLPLRPPPRIGAAALTEAQLPRWRPLVALALLLLAAESLLRLRRRRA